MIEMTSVLFKDGHFSSQFHRVKSIVAKFHVVWQDIMTVGLYAKRGS